MAVTHIESQAQFKDLLKSTKYVIADFTATWCGPCKAISPFYEKLATQHAKKGKLAFTKIDVDDLAEIAEEYSVTSMPTFLFFADGELSSDFSKVLGTNPKILTERVEALAKAANE
ncbi:thioredoxin-like protein [Grosmannia clavigera kw1407]|uniref:Thioredoxin n=1 Tax=Grosmannia clavigera (strain kw1407 / UAMH 11150) TaxID=655863 RepID=F0X8N5_GROCL|nr:thioredoxin-like protein [Grosmannia clavigera kw1407]EFX05982.1 thioredoxin-like protein [Grosmannia clavigera kw1407]